MKYFLLVLTFIRAETVYNQAGEAIECTCSMYDTETTQQCLDVGFDFVNGFLNDFAKDLVNSQFCNVAKSEITSCGFFSWIPEVIDESGCLIVCNASCGWAAGFIMQLKAFGITRMIFILIGILILVSICKKCFSMCAEAATKRTSEESDRLNNSYGP